MKKPIPIVVMILAGAVNTVFAEVQCNQFEIVLYGRVWKVTSYFVQDDITVNPNKDFEMLEPRGIACKMGVLYASGDREQWNTGSRLAVYTCQNTLLTYSTFLQMPKTSPEWWGPDGLTFNTSGDPLSYGAGPAFLVSVEADVPAQAGVINLLTAAVSGKMPLPPAQDITYIAATNQFAVIAPGTESSTVTIYDNTMAAAQRSFSVMASAAGMTSVSVEFARWMSRQEAGAEGVLMTAAKDSANTLALYDLAGGLIGAPQPLPVTPKARIPFEGGLYMIEPAFGKIEALAVDEENHTIFIGDFENAMIHVLTPVRLAGDINNSGTVDFSDMTTLAANWLLTGCLNPQWCNGADIQHSGTVDLADWAVLSEQFGESP
jgi:hypothetical protein